MSRFPNKDDLKKNVHKRINVWLIIVAIALLVDEYVKEGYLFDPNDVIVPATHENLLFWVFIIFLLLNIEKLRGRFDGL